MKVNFTVWFLRRFPMFRTMEKLFDLLCERVNAIDAKIAKLEKTAKSDAAFIESLNRYIDALEGRDKERVNRINELEKTYRENLKTIKELKGHLSGILPREE